MSKAQPKDNSRKTGYKTRLKEKKRIEAEMRNAEYQMLSLEEKLKRQKPGGKVWQKLQLWEGRWKK